MLYCKTCKEEVKIVIDGSWEIVGYSFGYRLNVSMTKVLSKELKFVCANCGQLDVYSLLSYCTNCRELFYVDGLFVQYNGVFCDECKDRDDDEINLLDAILRGV